MQIIYPYDSAELQRKRRILRREYLTAGKPLLKKRIAVLGGSTTSAIVEMLELFLLDYGIEPVFYESEYATYWTESVFPGKEFLSFKPDLIYFHTTSRNITSFPSVGMTVAEIDTLLQEEFARYVKMWDSVSANFPAAVIIQNNFEPPMFRLLGNSDFADRRGRVNFTNRLNMMLADYAAGKKAFYINDIAYAAACYGLDKWLEPKYWDMYKYALAVPAITDFSFNLANIIKSLYGKNKKAIALDLDNTLWGGVISEDGEGHIKIGKEMAIGAAFSEFGEYIKMHKDLGIVLTVASKNDMDMALAGLNHRDSVLKPEDFRIIKASWDGKDKSIEEIASELNIFPESIVFLDDNPAERSIVRANTGAIAPELDEIDNYIRIVDKNAFFEVTTIADDDLNRNAMYEQNALRQSHEKEFKSYGAYLRSLAMTAQITDFAPNDFARITSLVNKSNQFNLTTQRYNEKEIQLVTESADYIRLAGRLTDKFGENGIVSVAIGEMRRELKGDRLQVSLHIRLFLMSCRVLRRGMEKAMFAELYRRCREAGVKTIYGYYYPTVKNAMVKDLYKSFGFKHCQKSGKKTRDNGDEIWELEVTGETPPVTSRYIIIETEGLDI
ncbi:methoxymalonyl-ACP biosynthesis protein FkbH [Clostridia bacterium]|nr:methoxymalonyl-ACP biosynthesis protein FkbH [Clostridia bacterium]